MKGLLGEGSALATKTCGQESEVRARLQEGPQWHTVGEEGRHRDAQS